MKNIATKSIHRKKSIRDGLRVCVMRRIRSEYDFDMWIPALAPTEELLKAYVIEKSMEWEKFSKLYRERVLKKQTPLLKTLLHLSQKGKITLLCTETSYKKCHRYWIVEGLKKLSKNLH